MKLIILSLAVLVASCSTTTQQPKQRAKQTNNSADTVKPEIFASDNDSEIEKEKYLNFEAAITNYSTFSYFTVIKVKNLNNGVTKEICTQGNFVEGALDRERNAGGNQQQSYKTRYFEFKNIKALENISFFEYDPTLAVKIQSRYNFDKIVEEIRKNGKFSIRLSDDDMKAFAHVLFNRGYMTGESNCFGGTLQFVDRRRGP